MSVVTGPKKHPIEAATSGKPEVIPEGMYWCTECSRLHREDSEIGKKHLQYED